MSAAYYGAWKHYGAHVLSGVGSLRRDGAWERCGARLLWGVGVAACHRAWVFGGTRAVGHGSCGVEVRGSFEGCACRQACGHGMVSCACCGAWERCVAGVNYVSSVFWCAGALQGACVDGREGIAARAYCGAWERGVVCLLWGLGVAWGGAW